MCWNFKFFKANGKIWWLYSDFYFFQKVDENGNALQQNPGTKTKKKKIQTDKNVVVLKAESVSLNIFSITINYPLYFRHV